jgi:hypothetical protein
MRERLGEGLWRATSGPWSTGGAQMHTMGSGTRPHRSPYPRGIGLRLRVWVTIGTQKFGAVAQLGERRVRNAKVGSSILLRSTKLKGSDNFRALFLARNPRGVPADGLADAILPLGSKIGVFLAVFPPRVVSVSVWLAGSRSLKPPKSTTYAPWFAFNRARRLKIEPRHDRTLRRPVHGQRVALEPQQAHAPGLLPGTDRLHHFRLQQRQRRVVGRSISIVMFSIFAIKRALSSGALP